MQPHILPIHGISRPLHVYFNSQPVERNQYFFDQLQLRRAQFVEPTSLSFDQTSTLLHLWNQTVPGRPVELVHLNAVIHHPLIQQNLPAILDLLNDKF
jgi:hypothetical protein